jgi:exodeoxyribonuclease VII small subunit
MTEATTGRAAGTAEQPHETESEIGYADALSELESILDELDGDEVDVDVLGARVRRASELLRLCRERIAGARFEVEQVVGELEAEADSATAVADADDAGHDRPTDDTDDTDVPTDETDDAEETESESESDG